MRLTLLLAAVLMTTASMFAQSVGDTIVVQALNYNSTSRDTMVQFPDDASVSYEKIIMVYSMRCKDGKVSNQTNRNQGCGEWDYSCNTNITDSSRIDSVGATTASHAISGFSGTVYNYVTQPYYNLYQYTQTNVTQTINSETQSVVNTGSVALGDVLSTNENSGRSQYLYKQTELLASGVVMGNVDGIMLTAQQMSDAKFLRVRVKSTTDTALNSANVDTTGFTQVYFSDYNFAIGANRIQFYTPFNWDGVSNLIFEFSFTNSTTGSGLDITGESTSFVSGVVANNQYHMNTTAGNYVVMPVSNLSTITNEVSFSFWARGNSGIGSTNTVAIFAADPAGRKTLNVHLPWSNSRVYFDCGNTGTSVDRIDKLASASQLSGKWNHWAFTKNASTGVMKIYLNGNLFHSGTGKTKPIDIATLTFGANGSGSTIYGGDLDELRVWDKELTQTEIQGWMNRSVDSSHPQYSSLVAYYAFDEGSGNTVLDKATGTLSATFNGNAIWKYERGRVLNSFFSEKGSRPNLTVLQGNYILSNVPVVSYDSLQKVANNVVEYQIFPKPGTLRNDSIGSVSQWSYWHANLKYVYDGMNGNVISSSPIAPDGTINITDLDYQKRYASRFEIMSFVTPYGLGLDMGMEGESWTFDVTDYTPFLKGAKRIDMNRGGQWQEDIDIKFLFIVGTPPRDVLDVHQLWKVNKINYSQILNNTYFAPRDVMMHADGESFKVRSMITGHGQEGEFISRTHSINVNGGSTEFAWQVWKVCDQNPIYPQGGTWVYDRAGWCPGMSTQLVESDITPFVTPGQTSSIDYGLNTASGSSSYIVNHQLVTYGAFNHTVDAAVVDIIAPTDKVEYGRFGTTCIDPVVKIQNVGSTALNRITIEYWVNESTTPMEYTWMGNLVSMKTIEVTLPTDIVLWEPVTGMSNVFHARIKSLDNLTDEYSYNDHFSTTFTTPDVFPNDFVLWFKTNNRASENSFKIVDDEGNVVHQRSGMTNNTTYKDTLNLPWGCYKFEVLDTGGDGLSWWANAAAGNGYMRFWEVGAGIIKILEPDFGGEITFNFTVESPLSYEKVKTQTQFSLYPNPAHHQFVIEGTDLENATIFIYDALGQEVSLNYAQGLNTVTINTEGIAKGIYFVNIKYKDRIESKTVVIE